MSTKRGSRVKDLLNEGGFVRAKVRVELMPSDMVRILRDKHELTQSDLAERSGLSQSTISSIENGRVRLGVERAKALARALKVHPGVLAFPGWDVNKQSAA